MYRSSSSHSFRSKIREPKHRQEIQEKRKRLMTRNHERNQQYTAHHRESSIYQDGKGTPFKETGCTFRQGRGVSHRIKSSNFYNQINPWTSEDEGQYSLKRRGFSGQRKSNRVKSPLKLLKNEGQKDLYETFDENRQQKNSGKKSFLRKGTGVNRAIVLNVLKSKCNQIIADSAYSYSNYQPNILLCQAIKSEVPKGLKDVIGCEEMIKMSNIFTGGTIKSTNLHKKVNELIGNRVGMNEAKIEEEEDLTLKSIKRW